jgi:GNAT superfamily N-acetyltransferase
MPKITDRNDAPFDGDLAWRVNRTLRDGSSIVVRPILPEDREELRRGYLELSPESRYFRFLNFGTKAPSEDLLTYLTSVDHKDHVALGAVTVSPDLKTERGIGIARFIRLSNDESSPDKDTAEAAVTVADDMQRKGVGSILLRELLAAARVRNIKTLRAEVLENNATMRGILETARARRVYECEGAGTVVYDLPIEPPVDAKDEEAEHPTLFEVLRGAAETMALRFRAK